MTGMMTGQNIVVMGVANERSIAWGIAKSLHRAGANLILTYRKERSYQKLSQLLAAHEIKPLLCVSCDVADDASIEAAFAEIQSHVPAIHGLAHSVAFAEKDDLQGDYVDTTREGFRLAHDISA